MKNIYPFIPGKFMLGSGLLSRFLPPIPGDLTEAWLEIKIRPGNLIFDPFGTSPQLALQVARAGYKIVTCVNNPVARFLFNLEADPPSNEDFHSALAELAKSRVADERLEIHLSNLYRTKCSQCGNQVNADAFIWDRDANAPHLKIYDCTNCGDSGEHPVSQLDIELSQSFPATAMHRMRIIERFSTTDEKTRKNLLDALSVYPPRALYALITLVNRLESMIDHGRSENRNERIRKVCLTSLVLDALDNANNLWAYPSGRARPKQLSPSPIFKETNIWATLEQAADTLSNQLDPVEVTRYPEFPHGNLGLCIFEGPLRRLCEIETTTPSELSGGIGGVFTAIPRHNQAYWTLSALWAGWLWGHEALNEFKIVLSRRRYDWAWHCGALYHGFHSTAKMLTKQTPVFGVIAELESSFNQSAIIAADQAGYLLNGVSLRSDQKIAQIHWDYQPGQAKQLFVQTLRETQIQDLVIREGSDYLNQRGEPAPFNALHANALFTLAKNKGISGAHSTSSADEYNRVQHILESALAYKHGFIRHGGGEKSSEHSRYWHKDITHPANTLSDRIESSIRNLVENNPGINYFNLDGQLCGQYPGLLTPDSGLIDMCLESYCQGDRLKSGEIKLREQDKAVNRRLEIQSNCLALHDLGEKLGYVTTGDNPVIWEILGELAYVFHVLSTAEIGDILTTSNFPSDKSILTIPGARSNLLLYKIRNNFIFEQHVDRGWRFLKFRHLRQLLDSTTLNQDNFEIELDLDPLTEAPAQMRLL